MLDESLYIDEYVKYREYFNVMLQWTLLHQKKVEIGKYLYENGYKKVAIYGMADIGNCLAAELENDSNCSVLYAIDQGAPKLYHDIKCYKLADFQRIELKTPDIIIVTLPHRYDQIKCDIEKVVNCRTMSITELVYNAYYGIKME